MKIQDMFARPITREIKNVITVGKNESEEFEKQELEEYVVTRELLRHFTDFYSAYKKGIVGDTPKMGVWISGFFGSGKSHFLKMLSFLLENKVVASKASLDYFKEDGKISDAMLLADMELAANTPTDAILFNIDAKNSAHSKDNKDAIVRVFQKVFNEMQDYYGEIPRLADLEHELEESGRYEEFQDKFLEKKGKTWKENRHDLFFNQDIIVECLVEMGVMSEPAARNWCESATNPKAGDISIEQFAGRVRDYIRKKGNNHHVVFLVDEVGQYIGDNSKLMLNLQTVTEELGKACHGKAWVIVTSQQDIDSVTNVKGNDFSKIQGRFDTRLSLSAANVDEVVKERILKKTKTAKDTLELIYDDKETTLKNLISFTGTAEKKLYDNRTDYADIYPFVGYQFDLLGKVLTEVRTHGASGKNLADGERSMLAFFKEAANDCREKDEDTLVPFSAFYRALDNYLDHSHRSVILKAYDNKSINPDGKDVREDVFAIEVLKALFMIKYVREIDSNVENITSLMVSNVQQERGILRENVEKALDVLEKQLLIQRQGKLYIFLTNEEQEINRRIDRQQVETQEVTHRIGEIVFDELIRDKKYRYPVFGNRYSFTFDQIIDDIPYYSNLNNYMKVMVITPEADYDQDDATMSGLSMQNQSIVIQLPRQNDFSREVTRALKIENFIKKDSEAKALAQYDAIRITKGNEAKECIARAKNSLEDSLKESNIFICGNKAEIGVKDITKRLDEALNDLVRQVYHKLSYIDKPMDEAATKKMMMQSNSQTIDLFSGGGEANQQALSEMLNYIASKTGNHTKISMKAVKDRFEGIPYGFVDDDVFYLVARLFKRGEIAFTLQGEYVTLANREVKDILEYIEKKAYAEKLMIEKRERVSDKDKKTVRELMKELFGNPTATDDEDALMSTFLSHVNGMMEEIQLFKGQAEAGKYPGGQVIEKGIRLLNQIRDTKSSGAFFATVVKAEDELYDFIEDYEDVRKFFNGSQKNHFDEAAKTYHIYQVSQNYLSDMQLEKIAGQIRDILQNPKPYRRIKELPDLRQKFNDAYEEILTKQAEPVKESIEACRQRIITELNERPYKEKFMPQVMKKFDELGDEAEHSNNINDLMSLGNQAKAVQEKFLQKIAAEENRMAEEAKKKEPSPNVSETGNAGASKPSILDTSSPSNTYMGKKTKYIQIREVAGIQSIEIKSEKALDDFFAVLKKKFMEELRERDSIHIDF